MKWCRGWSPVESGDRTRLHENRPLRVSLCNASRTEEITVFHKANIMKMTDGLFLNCARRIHDDEYPNIEYEELIIDAGCIN